MRSQNTIMINPSANGWIDKFFIEQKPLLLPAVVNENLFYKKVRETGFIYGHIIDLNTLNDIDFRGWMRDEICKVALLNSLFDIYGLTIGENDTTKFLQKAVDFYDEMNPQGFNLLQKVLPNSSTSVNLEKIISERVETNKNIISKNFSHILTNALLFIDVLAFRQYLINGKIPKNYLKNMEETIIKIVSSALKTKRKASKYDELVIKLFEASVRYSKFSNISVQNLEELNLSYFTSDLEKYYLIDMAGMTLWSDGVVEENEKSFLFQLADVMDVTNEFVFNSIEDINSFILLHKKDIPYFNYSNPVKHFYDQTTHSVEVLISRNKKRLYKEITESGELMVLLAHSTQRDLDENEKKKIKKQLLDICKTIPSLTIFLLPGGSLLLPILIKFIPKLLPSAFNENLDHD